MNTYFRKRMIALVTSVSLVVFMLNLALLFFSQKQAVKTEGELLISQIEAVLDQNEKELEHLKEDLKESYLMRAKVAAQIIERDAELEGDVDKLRELAELLQVDQLHLFDATGTIYSGTHPRFNGYHFGSNKQMGYFAPMLEDHTLEMCEDLPSNTTGNNSVMYAMVWRADGKGMVQIGVSPERMPEVSDSIDLKNVFSNIPASKGCAMYVVDKASGQILGSTDPSYHGKTIEELHVSLPEDLSEPRIFFEMLKGLSYYGVVKEYKDYYIGITQTIGELYQDISQKVGLEAVFLLFVAVMVFRVTSHYEAMARKKEVAHQVALESALRKAEAASKAKTSFLFHMSHEVRTPMNAILGFVSVAQKHIDDKDRVMDSLNKLSDAGQHMLRLVGDVLDMARIESGKTELKPQPHRLSELMESTKNLFAQTMEKSGLAFSVDWDVQNDIVFVDRLRFEQIELNLIGNAIKYTPEGGSITYRFRQIGEVSDGQAVYEGEISDTGIGMSKEFVEHVFDAFERENSSTVDKIQGSGLGLTITQKLLSEMNGTISCESEQGVGSTFRYTMTLRVGEEKDLPTKEEATAVERFSFAGKRILLVEDNEMNREIAMEILSEYGFEVDTAEDGVVAVDKMMQSSPGEYDLILMDIQMPNMDGYKATVMIRQMQKPYQSQIPIVALTANAFEEDRRNALEAGMNDHLPKPIDIALMMETLSRIMGNSGEKAGE